MEAFSLKSAHEETSLTFSPLRAKEDSVLVDVEAPGLKASATVYAYMPHGFITTFFDDLAESWRGWTGDKCWESLEGELALRASADKLGHISLRFVLRSGQDRADWSAGGTVVLEANQLQRIAADAQEFFNQQGLLRAI